jgi:hypothetical protein
LLGRRFDVAPGRAQAGLRLADLELDMVVVAQRELGQSWLLLDRQGDRGIQHRPRDSQSNAGESDRVQVQQRKLVERCVDFSAHIVAVQHREAVWYEQIGRLEAAAAGRPQADNVPVAIQLDLRNRREE